MSKALNLSDSVFFPYWFIWNKNVLKKSLFFLVVGVVGLFSFHGQSNQ